MRERCRPLGGRVLMRRRIRRWPREIEAEIDRAWAASPNPGRVSAVHRLNRSEYNNAVRDLLGLDPDLDVASPAWR